MSHPLETSMASRELAEHVYRIAENPPRPWSDRRERDEYCIQDMHALIEAWVRVRESNAEERGVRLSADFLDREANANFTPNEPAKLLLHGMASALRLNLLASSIS